MQNWLVNCWVAYCVCHSEVSFVPVVAVTTWNTKEGWCVSHSTTKTWLWWISLFQKQLFELFQNTIVDFLTALYCLQPVLKIPGYTSSPAFFCGSSEKPHSAQAGSCWKSWIIWLEGLKLVLFGDCMYVWMEERGKQDNMDETLIQLYLKEQWAWKLTYSLERNSGWSQEKPRE